LLRCHERGEDVQDAWAEDLRSSRHAGEEVCVSEGAA